ncbi:MAG: AzlC family ABC transporter permease [Gorillibacterium sp.]|nr:AzlC family ABC transporter permease [Gorillibacterium sp.]
MRNLSQVSEISEKINRPDTAYYNPSDKGATNAYPNQRTQPVSSDWKEGVSLGLRAGFPVAIGYLPIALAFGMLTKSAGIPAYVGVLLSLIVFAGASQFVGISMLAASAALPEIFMTTFILNFRHFLMTTAISQKLDPGIPRRVRAMLAFGITDETFAIASLKNISQSLSAPYLFGLNSIAFIAWNVGTWAGLILSDGLPAIIQNSMGVSLYVMFIALLIPGLKASPPAVGVAIIAISFSCLFTYVPFFLFLSGGWIIVLSTIIASACGAWLWKGEQK